MALSGFHPAVARWFSSAFAGPTEPQRRAWPAILGAAADAGGGADRLGQDARRLPRRARRSLPPGPRGRADATRPRWSTSRRSRRCRTTSRRTSRSRWPGSPRRRARWACRRSRSAPWCAPATRRRAERQRMVKRPPHVLVTTPESLYILLTSESGRRMLGDRAHGDRRRDPRRGRRPSAARIWRCRSSGWRPWSRRAAAQELLRIGLSATQRPVEEVARFLLGGRDGAAPRIRPERAAIVDEGHRRALDLGLELPGLAARGGDVGRGVDRGLRPRWPRSSRAHRTTLVFVNTRRLSERVAAHLAGAAGRGGGGVAPRLAVARAAAARSRSGSRPASCAPWWRPPRSSWGSTSAPSTWSARSARCARSPRSCSASGAPAITWPPSPRAASSRCRATSWSRARRSSTRCGAASSRRWRSRRAARHPGAADRRRVRGARVGRGRALRAGARRLALSRSAARGLRPGRSRCSASASPRAAAGAAPTCTATRCTAGCAAGAARAWRRSPPGGAIPDQGDFHVIEEPTSTFVGTINEDFAIESLPGDIFQLGNISWRIRKIEEGRVLVENAQGAPPTLPFWLGEAPGRSRGAVARASRGCARRRIASDLGLDAERASGSACARAARARRWRCELSAELALPLGRRRSRSSSTWRPPGRPRARCRRQETLVVERFFDEAGDQHSSSTRRSAAG